MRVCGIFGQMVSNHRLLVQVLSIDKKFEKKLIGERYGSVWCSNTRKPLLFWSNIIKCCQTFEPHQRL